jgi:C-terminal processing protease CtpA/Prc
LIAAWFLLIIAFLGGRDNPHFVTSAQNSQYLAGDLDIVVTDVLSNGPAFGLVQVGDRVIAANGVSLENADYSTAVALMKEAEQLNMVSF